MSDIFDATSRAWHLLFGLDPDLIEILMLSLRVSLTSTVIASVFGLLIGSALALGRFPGRSVLVVVVNTLMGLPPVVVGLLVYLVLSRSGPLGVFGLLFTPTAMIIAQVLLVLPIVAALSRQVLADYHAEYDETFRSLGVSRWRSAWTLLCDARWSLFPVLLAGFGRAISEVGAVIIVGGNIDHVTRVMTTAIALETSKGQLALALALGMILLLLTMVVNGLAEVLRMRAGRGAISGGVAALP